MVIAGVHAVVPYAVTELGLSPILGSAGLFLFNFYVGCSANDWRREKLERTGHVMAGLGAGRSSEEADLRFFDEAGRRGAVSEYGHPS